jgi:hypothetical protein
MEENQKISIEELLQKNAILEKEIAELKKDSEKKKEKRNEKRREYYETHREEEIKKVREYQDKTNYVQKIPPEKKKEYARKAYLKKKEKDRLRREQEEKEQEEPEQEIIFRRL